MTKVVFAIGVSDAAGLAPIPGAARDAKRIVQWAAANGYETHLLVDDAGKRVFAHDVYNGLDEIVSREDVECLIIYFAGHGYAPQPGAEFWLLSDWKRNGNEAINALSSLVYAQSFDRPRIALIADTCRTTWTTPVPPSGTVILPRRDGAPVAARVDEFYATKFGFVAQGVTDADALKSFGLFSRELFNGLSGKAAEARDENLAVTSRALKEYLDDAVPSASTSVGGAVLQVPQTNAQWRKPDDVYALFPNVAVDAGPPGPVLRRSTRFRVRDSLDILLGGAPKRGRRDQGRKARQDRDDETQRLIEDDVQRYMGVDGRQSFETGTGITIVGAKVDNVVIGAACNLFEEFGASQIRVHDDQNPQTALVRIADGRWRDHWMVIATVPNLIATALVDENGFSSLNYRRSLSRPPDFGYESDSPELEQTLARVTAMFRHGVMPSEARMLKDIQALRHRKYENPALAVIAAHICHRIGEFEQIAEMENHGIGYGAYTPYDLVLLSGTSQPSHGRKRIGDIPLFARGWSLLPTARFEVPQALEGMSSHIVNSLWSMATPAGGELLAAALAAMSAVPA